MDTVEKHGNRIDITMELSAPDKRNEIDGWQVDTTHPRGVVSSFDGRLIFFVASDESDARWLTDRLNAFANFERESREYMAEYVDKSLKIKASTESEKDGDTV